MPDLAPPLGMSTEHQLRRSLLRATRSDALLQDQIDCALLARACGYEDEARALLMLVFLQQGYAPEAQASRLDLIQRTGLWPSAIHPEEMPQTAASFPVTLALEELRSILRREPADEAPPQQQPVVIPTLRSAFSEPSPVRKKAVLRLAEALTGRLANAAPFPPANEAASLLHGARELLDLQPVAIEEFLGEADHALASIAGLELLRRFVVRIAPLLDLEQESLIPILGLSTSALGPYFTNIPHVIRNARDLFALIEAAADHPPSQAFIERWTLLLSLHLQRKLMIELLDEYGDRGMVHALSILLQRSTASDPGNPPKDMVWTIRDAFLDMGELQLGGQAQELIAYWSPRDPLEWELLSDIRSAADDRDGARDALSYALTLDPNRPAARQRVALLEAGERAKVFGGFGSAARRPLRLSRLAMFRSAV